MVSLNPLERDVELAVGDDRRAGCAAASRRQRARRVVIACAKLMVVDSASGVNMLDEMGTFRTTIEIENPARRGERRTLESVLVDTGAELSWVPAPILESLGVERDKRLRFRQVSGAVLERWTGVAIVHAGGTRTADDVVFGEPGDVVLLGARSLEGLNLRVDPVLKQLVDAGPAPAAHVSVR